VTPDPNDIMKNVEQYLIEQRDLFGNIIYTDQKKSSSRDSAPSPVHYPNEEWVDAASLDDLREKSCTCVKCPLGHTRTNFVYGVGNPHATVIFVGEAPGADEDAQGEPFVGRAGQLLNKILAAVELKREEVYICNILKCRPPNNRDPQPTEMELCSPYLFKQIEFIRPKFIICLGRISAQWFLQTTSSLTSLRGRTHDFHNAKLIVTYHPAALLRNPNWKKPAWEDMKMFKALYDAEKKKD
jgi:uracil-DNA glycosylase